MGIMHELVDGDAAASRSSTQYWPVHEDDLDS